MDILSGDVLPTPGSTPSHAGAAAADAPVVAVEGVTKRFVDSTYPVIANLDLAVREGEILSLLGPSGCGKTTLLRILAGFDAPDVGMVRLRGREMVAPGVWVHPEARRIGFVFQDYALFPHLTVRQNVAFGVRARRPTARLARAAEVLDLVGLSIFADRFPHQLSGGQQQRVALARALAPGPEVILLDEPFSNLDAALRDTTRDEIRQILKVARTTAILVTHDQEEALSFGDRLAVMRAGRLEQVGRPEDVYRRPRTAFVASFLGRTNVVRGHGHGTTADTLLGPVDLARPATGTVLLSLRPEDLAFDERGGVPAQVLDRQFHGHDLTFTCELIDAADDAPRLTIHTTADARALVGQRVRLVATGPAVPLEGSTTGAT